MTTQSEHHQAGFMQSVAGQMAMLAAGLAVVLVVAWFYVF